MKGENPTRGTIINDEQVVVKDCDARVLFSTPAHYSRSIFIIIAFSFSMGIISNIPILVDPKATQMELEIALKAMIWAACSLAIVFSLVFPRSFTVHSNATVGVLTLLGCEFKFSHVVDAHESAIWNDFSLRPKWKFATSTTNRVRITRANGKWDVLISPTDVTGFLAALEESTSVDVCKDDNVLGPGDNQL